MAGFSSPQQEKFIRARAAEGLAWAIKRVKEAEEGGAKKPVEEEPPKTEGPPKAAVNAEGTKIVKQPPKTVVKKH